MNVLKLVLLTGGLLSASLAAAQEPAGAGKETERLREEIRERREEIREDRRELRELERERRKHLRPGPLWVNLGLNVSHVDRVEHNGLGGQGGLSFGSALMLRIRHSEITYGDGYYTSGNMFERQNGSDTSVQAGWVLGRSGFFLAGGHPGWTTSRRRRGPGVATPVPATSWAGIPAAC